MKARITVLLLTAVLGLSVFPLCADAATNLTIAPISWNVIGLDSNNVDVGPNHFPVGARVCNGGGSSTTLTQVKFIWDDGLGIYTSSASADAYINLRDGTTDTLLPNQSLAAGACYDAYFEVVVNRLSTAYNNVRRYHITATDSGGTVSTTVPRELFVEHLISQSRNSVSDIQFSSDGSSYTSVPPGGTMSVTLGNTYWIKLIASTATNGYEQEDTFVNFPNTVFQVLSASALYTADSSGTVPNPNDKFYGDACVWENDPNSPNYRSCLSTGKVGGNITVIYQVKILAMPATVLGDPLPLTTLINDFSGSSYHYNSDFGVAARYIAIVDPTSSTIAKSFTPATVGIGGISRLTITITNANPATVSGYNFTDPLPTTSSPSTQMQVAATPNATTSACGSPTFSPSAGATTLSFSNGTIAGNGTCSISVDVTTTTVAPVSYTNTTNNLFVDTHDTGKNASAILTVTTAPTIPSPPSTCASPLELASWNFDTATTPNPAYSAKAANVTTATATYYSAFGGTEAINNTYKSSGNTTNAWGATGPNANPATNGWSETAASANNYFEFTLDTSKYGGVYVTFDVDPDNGGDWANPKSNIFVKSSADGGAFTTYTLDPTPAYPQAAKGNWTTGLIATAATTGTSSTKFRISVDSASKAAALLYLDNVKFMGCLRPDPPTILKSFSPSAVAVGSTSTMTLTITNPTSSAGQNLSGISVTDYLPEEALQGTAGVTNNSTAVTGTGTAFTSQLATNSIVLLPSALAGSLSVTQNSKAITGSGTSFTTDLVVGSIITINSNSYTVATITDNTHLTLSSAYTGTTASGLSASVYKNYTVSSITDDTHLTLGSNYSGTTGNVTMLAGLTFDITTAPSTTCGSPITNVISGGRAITLSGSSLTGTVTLTNASATVTGAGTQFTTEVGANRILNLPFQLAGTVAVTNASKAVVGTTTTFTTQLAVGSAIAIYNGSTYDNYIVAGITDNTHLELSTTYAGTTATGRNIRGYKEYTVSSVGSNTSLTLTAAYASAATLSGISISPKLASVTNNTCTVTATVRANAAGVRTNVTELVSAAESGTNTTASGYASADLTALLPPVISKIFGTNPILAGGVSKLTFTIRNPNQNVTLTGLAFSDTFPTTPGTGMKVAATPNASNTCGGTFTPTANAGSITFPTSGAPSLSGGSSCTVTVDVTAPNVTGNLSGTVAVTNGSNTVTGTGTSFSTQLAAGDTIYIASVGYRVASISSNTSLTLTKNYGEATASLLVIPSGYFNISGAVSSTNGGTGNTASDTLMVRAANPSLSFKKFITSGTAVAPTGQWLDKTLAIAVGGYVWYEFLVENTGDVALNPVSVTDDTLTMTACNTALAGAGALPAPVAANDNHIRTCVVGPITAVSGSHTNTAHATGTYSGTPYNSNNDTASYMTTGLTLAKSVDAPSYSSAGGTFTYTFTVTNSGYASLAGPVTVADCFYVDDVTENCTSSLSVTCPSVTTLHAGNNFLATNEIISCSATYTLTASDVSGNPAIKNKAQAATTSFESIPSVTSNWAYAQITYNPTFVSISDFRAYEEGGRTVVQWETTTEHNTLGFYLLRLNETTGEYEQINRQLIPAFAGSPRGGTYRLADDGAYAGGTYTYKLTEVETRGAKTQYGPFTVQVLGTGAPLKGGFSRQPHGITDAKLTRIANAKIAAATVKAASALRKGDALKISIRTDGLYFLPVADIAAILRLDKDVAVSWIKNRLFNLTDMGKQIAYKAAKDGSGIYFYGKGIDSNYTRDNVYVLSPGLGLLMAEVRSGTLTAAPAGTSFTDKVHFEQDSPDQNWQNQFSDPDADYWFWDAVWGGIDGMDVRTFTLNVNDPAPLTSAASLSVNLMAVPTSDDSGEEHHIAVSLNGTALGEAKWKGGAAYTYTATFNQALLKPGGNTVDIHAFPDAIAGYGITLVDSFDLSYMRSYKAIGDSLRFRADNSSKVTVGGFTNSAISLFDVTDPNKPKSISGGTIGGSTGDYRITFRPQSTDTLYLAVSPAGIYWDFTRQGRVPSTLSGKDNRADYLIITTAGLRDSAQTLAAYRKSKGLEVMVVDIETIMDTFNFSVSSPKAIKSFLLYTYKNWAKAPKYVVLAGNGTYDYKDLIGFGDNLIPQLMTATPEGLFPSDNVLVDMNGDSVPDMSIGRLPVVSADELKAVVNKIISYENSLKGNWSRNIIMAAGAADRLAGDFPSDSNSVASLIPSGYFVDKIYLSDYSSMDAATERLIQDINAGCYLVNYIGHGSIDRLDLGGLLMNSDVVSMTNGSSLPIVSAMTCFMNNFSYPGYDALGEALLLAGGKGAAAVWGPTGLSVDAEAVLLDKKFFKAVFVDGERVLGDAVRKAIKEYAKDKGQPFIMNIYNIVGDPALRIR